MSSPRVATASRPAKRPAPPQPAPPASDDTLSADALSADAKRIAAEIEQALAKGETNAITLEALQALMAAVCRDYAAQVEAGQEVLPLGLLSSVIPIEAMTTANGLLRAVKLAVLDLDLWQNRTGRC